MSRDQERERLLSAMDSHAQQKPRKVAIKGWDYIYLRKRTIGEIEDHEERAAALQAAEEESGDDKQKRKREKELERNKVPRRLCGIICDESGDLLFDAEKPDDIALVRKMWRSQPDDILGELNRAIADDETVPGN